MFEKEKVIEVKKCRKCNSTFEITNKDLDFYEKVSPSFWWKKYNIPSPTFCSDCRQQRRLSFRNERNLYKRKCDATGKEIVSVYSPDKKLKVYNQDFWWSDKWDPMDYWINFDFNKTFFEQFNELLIKVPKINLDNDLSNINSEYVNFIVKAKDCYLCFWWWFWERVMFSNLAIRCLDSLDLYFSFDSENCYESINLKNCKNIFFSKNVIDSNKCYFIENCIWCEDCILSYNLNNKKYCVNNIQYSKDEYFKIKSDFISKLNINWNMIKFQEIFNRFPKKSLDIYNSELSLWELIVDSKNVFNSYVIQEWLNLKYCRESLFKIEDSYDCFQSWVNTSLWYEVLTSSMNIYNPLFSMVIRSNCNNIIYSSNIHNSSNLFWCVWLRNKQYCIFNKQYTKEEYEELVPKIIEHMKNTWEWWEFFPTSLSLFGYNETVAQEYYISDMEDALEKWFKWSNYEASFPKVEKIIPGSKLPYNIEDIPDDILNWAIECELTKKPFRIIKQELDFYRKHKLPIPRRHPDQRHLDRMCSINLKKLYYRKCDKCSISMQTIYWPERSEIVYCEECYSKET